MLTKFKLHYFFAAIICFCLSVSAYSQNYRIADYGFIFTSTGATSHNATWTSAYDASSNTTTISLLAIGNINTYTINTSVIQNELNLGRNVILDPGNLVTSLGICSAISKTSGGDATLTLKSNKRVDTYVVDWDSGPVVAYPAPITSTSGKLNVVIQAEIDGGTDYGVSVSSITTNGGHIWIGGGSSSATSWNGLTVGSGPAYYGNPNPSGTIIPVTVWLNGNLNTNSSTTDGDVLISADGGSTSNGNYGDISGMGNDSEIDAGDGNVTLLSENSRFFYSVSSPTYITIKTRGILTVAPPNEAKRWTTAKTLFGNTSTSGGITTWTGLVAYDYSLGGLKIYDIANLGGFTWGTYHSNTYTPVSTTVDLDFGISGYSNSSYSFKGPVSIYGKTVEIYAPLEVQTPTNPNITSSYIHVKADEEILVDAASGLTTAGGDVVLWADADGVNDGFIKVANNITTSGGNIIIGGGSASTSHAQSGLGSPIGFAYSATDNYSGVLVVNSTLDARNAGSGTGNISIKGHSNESGSGIDMGTLIVHSNIYTDAGAISVDGKKTKNSNKAAGLWIGTTSEATPSDAGNTTITSGSGNITLQGNGDVVSGGGTWTSWLHAMALYTHSGYDLTITSTSGDITLNGTCTPTTATFGPTSGIQIWNNASNTGSFTEITTGGTLNVVANTGNGGSNDYGLDFNTGDVPGNFKFGNSNTTAVNISCSSFRNYNDNQAGTVQIQAKSNGGSYKFEPAGTSFDAAIDLVDDFDFVSGCSGGITIGKPTNNADLTLNTPLTSSGPISIYGDALTLNKNVSSTAGGNISVFGNSLGFATGKTLSSSGQLQVAPQLATNTIGVNGATGTLQITSTHLSTNFVNGFYNITVGSDNQSGNISVTSFNPQDNLTFKTSGSLSLGATMSLGSNNVRLGDGLTFSGSNYFKTDGTGSVIRNIANNTAYTFPVGNITSNPITITNKSGASDDFSVRVIDEVYSNSVSGALVTTPHVKRTWDIGKILPNGGSGVDIVFNWTPASQISAALTIPKMYHYESSAWVKKSNTSNTTYNTTSGTLNFAGYTGSFSPFTVMDDGLALPVNWLTFTGKQVHGDVVLNWSTASEINNSHFEIQRSANAIDFSTIGSVAAGTNPSVVNNYQYLDVNPLTGISYYRLKQIDIDGKYSFSSIIQINGTPLSEIKIYSDAEALHVLVPASVSGTTIAFIYDATGRLMQKQQVLPGRNVISTAGLSGGNYFVQLVNGGKNIYSNQFVK
jgi:hypothetical protein